MEVFKEFLVCSKTNKNECLRLQLKGSEESLKRISNGAANEGISNILGMPVVIREPYVGEDVSIYPFTPTGPTKDDDGRGV